VSVPRHGEALLPEPEPRFDTAAIRASLLGELQIEHFKLDCHGTGSLSHFGNTDSGTATAVADPTAFAVAYSSPTNVLFLYNRLAQADLECQCQVLASRP
jgi:hypothetical protein